MKTFAIVFFLLLSHTLWAEMGPSPASVDENAAKLRAYPGGQDEDPLKVQEELPVPIRRVYKSSIHKKVLKGLLKEKEEATAEAGTSEKSN